MITFKNNTFRWRDIENDHFSKGSFPMIRKDGNTTFSKVLIFDGAPPKRIIPLKYILSVFAISWRCENNSRFCKRQLLEILLRNTFENMCAKTNPYKNQSTLSNCYRPHKRFDKGKERRENRRQSENRKSGNLENMKTLVFNSLYGFHTVRFS